MAITTKQALRQALSEIMGDYLSFTATADGSSAKNTVVSNTLKNFQGGADEGGLEEQYLLATGGGNAGEARRCLQYHPDATGGAQAIVQSTFTNATSNGDGFELHRIDPALKDQAVARALIELLPALYLPIRDETLIVDSILLNGDMEDFTGSDPDSWTSANSPTLSKETSTVFHGTNALKMVGPASAVGQVYQDLSLISITEIEGITTKFKMRVWTNAASQARLILNDGVTTTNGDYHTGGSEWQLLEVSAAIGPTATRARVTCEVTATDTAYFDTGWAKVNPVYRYTVPASIIRGPVRILQQYNEALPTGPYYAVREGEVLTEGRILRLEGMGVLTRPSSESATTEIGEPQVRLVAAYAAMALNEALLSRAAMGQQGRLEAEVARWQREVARLSRQFGIRMPPLPTERFDFIWDIGEDAGGRYIDSLAARRGIAFTTL